MNEKRLEEIESTLAHHEQSLQDLSDLVQVQWKEIERLKRHLERASDTIEDLQDRLESGDKPMSVSDIAARNKPPHY
ncbi:MAG: SlyX family protein [Alphaproteobacteria bacterium]|nr:SlyX family protein [Alphaproteobacteria bacterium]